jgi:hypothetical protein
MRRALHPRHPELVALVEGARNGAREVAIFAAQTALQRTPVSEHPVPEALNALRTDHAANAMHQRPQLEAVVERLDGIYWDLCDAGRSKGTSAVEEAFARARAVNSLVAALTVDPVAAALDAIYEAQASLPDAEVDGFIEAAKGMLRSLQVEKP